LTPDAEPLRTREALQAHFTAVASRLAGTVTTLHADRVRLHESTDPEVIVAEFDYVGQGPQGEFALPQVFVMRVRDGEIVESRDYPASQA
jgi:ketosteroid isomerase-like protein